MWWGMSQNLNYAGPCITINFTLKYIARWSGDLPCFHSWYFLLWSLSCILFIYHYSLLTCVSDTEIKAERWKCYRAHSHVWNNNAGMISPRLARFGVVTFPGITTTRWRADVNRKEYQRRAIRKSSAQYDWYVARHVPGYLWSDLSHCSVYFQCSHSVEILHTMW